MSETLRDRIVAEALAWRDTPYQHQAGLKGVAADCIRFVVGVLQHLGRVGWDWWEREGKAYASYGRTSGGDVMLAALRLHLREIPVDEAQAGDVVYMSFGDGLHHAGILVPYRHGGLALVHAHSSAGRVVEHRLDSTWRGYIRAAFVVPEEAC